MNGNQLKFSTFGEARNDMSCGEALSMYWPWQTEDGKAPSTQLWPYEAHVAVHDSPRTLLGL